MSYLSRVVIQFCVWLLKLFRKYVNIKLEKQYFFATVKINAVEKMLL